MKQPCKMKYNLSHTVCFLIIMIMIWPEQLELEFLLSSSNCKIILDYFLFQLIFSCMLCFYSIKFAFFREVTRELLNASSVLFLVSIKRCFRLIIFSAS